MKVDAVIAAANRFNATATEYLARYSTGLIFKLKYYDPKPLF